MTETIVSVAALVFSVVGMVLGFRALDGAKAASAERPIPIDVVGAIAYEYGEQLPGTSEEKLRHAHSAAIHLGRGHEAAALRVAVESAVHRAKK